MFSTSWKCRALWMCRFSQRRLILVILTEISQMPAVSPSEHLIVGLSGSSQHDFLHMVYMVWAPGDAGTVPFPCFRWIRPLVWGDPGPPRSASRTTIYMLMSAGRNALRVLWNSLCSLRWIAFSGFLWALTSEHSWAHVDGRDWTHTSALHQVRSSFGKYGFWASEPVTLSK